MCLSPAAVGDTIPRMADITTCPNCQRKLQLPDQADGQEVQCPACGETFTPEPGRRRAAPTLEAQLADDPVTQGAGAREAAQPWQGLAHASVPEQAQVWRSVRTGVTFQFVAHAL